MKVNDTGLIGIHKAVDGSSKWTQAQKDDANKILKTLPVQFRNCTKRIVREGNIIPGALGWSDMRGNVFLPDCSCDGRSFQGPIVHEMTHNFIGVNPTVIANWKSQFWASGQPNPPSVSGYGNTNCDEDLCESVRTYWQIGPQMKQTQPDRYAFIKKYVMQGIDFDYHVDNQ